MGSTIDALIAQGPRPVQTDPNAIANRIITLRQAAQGQQLQREQIAAAQQENQMRGLELQDQEVMRKAYMDSGGDLDKAQQLAAKLGASPKAIIGLQQMKLDMKQKYAALDEKTLANEQARHDQLRGELQSYMQQPDDYKSANWQPWVQQHVQTGRLTPQEGAQLIQQYPKYPGDDQMKFYENGLATGSQMAKEVASQAEAAKNRSEAAKADFELSKQKRDLALQNLSGVKTADDYNAWRQQYPDVAKMAPATYSPAWVAQQVRTGVPVKDQPEYDINANKARLGLMGNGEFDQYLAKYAESLNKKPSDLSPNEWFAGMQKYAELKRDPEMRSLAIANANLANLMRQQQLAQMPTADQAKQFATDLINHRIAPDQFSQIMGRDQNGGFRRMVYSEAKKMQPDFDFEQANAEYQLTKSPGFQQTIRYMDSAVDGLARIEQNARKVANGGVTSINQLVNAGKAQFQDVDLAKLKTDMLLESDEIAKILAGGGTGNATSDKKLGDAQSILKTSDSPAVIAGTLGEVRALVGYRRKALTKGTYLESVPNANAVGGTQWQKTAINPQTKHRIGSNDDGNTWYDVETGKRVQ